MSGFDGIDGSDFDAIVEASLSDLKTPAVSDMLEEMSKGWPAPVNTASDVRASIIDSNNAWMGLSDMWQGQLAQDVAQVRGRTLQLTFNRVTAALSFLAGLAIGGGSTAIFITAVQ